MRLASQVPPSPSLMPGFWPASTVEMLMRLRCGQKRPQALTSNPLAIVEWIDQLWQAIVASCCANLSPKASMEPSSRLNVLPCLFEKAILVPGDENDSLRDSNFCRFVDCRGRGRTIDHAIGRKAANELYDFVVRDHGKCRRKNIEFDGDREERNPARCRRLEFSRSDGAERRQTHGSPFGLPAGFQAEVAAVLKSRRPAKYLPDQEKHIRIRSGTIAAFAHFGRM